MIVVVNGGYRTGSTVVYNIIGCLVEKAGIGRRAGLKDKSEVNRLIQASPEATVVAKSHTWYPKESVPGHVRVVYTYRQDIRDCVASVLLIKPWTSAKALENLVMTQCALTKHMSSFEGDAKVLSLEYSGFYRNNDDLAKRLAAFLQLDLTEADVLTVASQWTIEEVLTKMRTMEGEMHSPSELRKNHVSAFQGRNGYWESILTAEQIAMIEGYQRDPLPEWLP